MGQEVVTARTPEELIAAGEAIVIPTGELIPLDDPVAVALGLDALATMKQQIDELRRTLVRTVEQTYKATGRKTTRPDDGVEVVLNGGPEDEYDAEQLAELLLAAGMPKATVDEIVYPVTEWKVRKVPLNQAAKANPDYAAAAELCRRTNEKPYTVKVTIDRRRQG